MTARTLLILNPASGDHDADETERAVTGVLEDGGHRVQVRRTEAEGDARSWAQEAASSGDVDLVVAAGGDGTVREVVSGVVRAAGDVPVAIVPTGTANLLARALGVPVDDPAAAGAVATAGPHRRLDVLHLVDRDEHALLMVDGGFDARLVRDASRRLKNVAGSLAYVAAGLRNTVGLAESAMVLELDGETLPRRGHSVLCLNVGRIGQSVVISEEIQPDDGHLHVGVVRGDRPWGVLWTALAMVAFGRDAHPNVEWHRAREVRIDADPPLALHVDGDEAGATPVHLAVLPSAITVVVPERG